MLRRSPVKREPYTTCALPRSTGARSFGQSSGSYSRSASWMSTRSPVTCSSPVRIAAPLPRLSVCVTTRTVLSASWREHLARAVGAAVVDEHDLAVDRKLDRAHPPHDLHDRVALVVDGDDDRELRGTASLAVRLRVTGPSGTTRGAGETFAEIDPRAPNRGPRGERDVGTPLLRIVDRQRLVHDLRTRAGDLEHGVRQLEHRELVGLPMFIGPRWSDSSRARMPATSSST